MGESSYSTTGFAEYLQSVVQLNTLEKMTQDLDRELSDSQRLMMEIKAIYEYVPQDNRPEAENKVLGHEDLTNFLDEGVPKLLMPDMAEITTEVNIDDIIDSIKTYVENLKMKMQNQEQQYESDFQNRTPKKFVSLDLEQYAISLDQLSKRVANIKLNKKDELYNRNIELEGKLTQLCDDVNKFTTMIQAKTTLSENNQKQDQHTNNDSHQYDMIIGKLVSSINEVTYLLQNKN